MAQATKSISNNESEWEEAVALYREQLRFYLDYLIRCQCDHKILAKVEAEVRERSVPNEFKLSFLTRTLVRNVIQHLRECTEERESSSRHAQGSPNTPANLTVQERMVYFMRDILEYSTRDTSLLIGITDTQVEKLLSFARRRIDMTEGPSALEIETPDGAYFKWKFVDLHLG